MIEGNVINRPADGPVRPQRKNACYGEFLEADWKTLLKESSDEQVEEELTRMLLISE